MKILFFTPLLPWPLVSGGQIRAYNLLKALQKHEVTLVTYLRDEKERQGLLELKKICREVSLIKRQYRPWTVKALVKTLFSVKPLVMNLYETKNTFGKTGGTYDVIYCECFYLMDKLPESKASVFLSEQNIEYLAYQRYLDHLPFWKKIFLCLPMKIDIEKMKFWEKRMWRKATGVAVMSEIDKQQVEKERGGSRVAIIPNGVDTINFQPATKISQTKTILFVGNFSWFQNLQAIEWLVKRIFPIIKQKIPAARLLVVGRRAPLWLKSYRAEGMILDEQVEDIRNVYGQSTVLLAPLKSGGGTKYKILEAMASGLPVVTTPLGAEGLEEDCLIVKRSTEELAQATVDVLNRPEDYLWLTKKARRLVEENYDWSIIGKKLERFLTEK